MTLRRIRLELARDHDFPNGSAERGYEIVAPLDADGHLIAKDWRIERARCRVVRFWPGEKTEVGLLVHKPGGTWVLDYDPTRESDDEPGYKLDKHRFAPGEYVSFREHDGHSRTFRVVSVSGLESER